MITIEKPDPPARATVGKMARICGPLPGCPMAVIANTNELEMSAEFETETFTGPAVVTSFAGMDTTIVSQLSLEAQCSAIEGPIMSAAKCTVDLRESPWPF